MVTRKAGWLLGAIGLTLAMPAAAGTRAETTHVCLLDVAADGAVLHAEQLVQPGSTSFSSSINADVSGIAPAGTYFDARLGTDSRFDLGAQGRLWLSHVALTNGAPVRWRLIGARSEHVETTRFRSVRPLELDWAKLDAEFAGDDAIRFEVTNLRERKPIASGILRLDGLRAAARLRSAAIATLAKLAEDREANCAHLDDMNGWKLFELDCRSADQPAPMPGHEAALAVFQHETGRRCGLSARPYPVPDIVVTS